MRSIVVCVAVTMAGSATAAEVVWLVPHDGNGAFEAQIVAEARPTRGALEPLDLLTAAGDERMSDRGAHDGLDKALQDVRSYESRLDGELVIMDDVQRALDRIEILQGEGDRDRVFRALAYQGFAVHRFFEETLASDDRGAAYRVELNDVTWVKPWAQALALEPDRKLTRYEVAESPQRIAYSEQAATYGAEVLPGTFSLQDSSWLDGGATLHIDARAVQGTDHKLMPGIHWVHLEQDGHVIDSVRLELSSGQTTEWAAQRTAAGWTQWLDGVQAGGMPQPDAGLKADVLALGGEVWFVVQGRKGPKALSLSVAPGGSASWSTVSLGSTARADKPAVDDGLSFAARVGVGWVYSGDFYTQDPVSAPHSPETVNSLGLDVGAQAAYDLGPARIVAGIDVLFTPGEHHVALTGEGSTRFRPTPYLGAGIEYAQVNVGYVLPYHFAVGPAVSVPVMDGLELHGRAWFGLPGDRSRSNGTTYEARFLSAVQLGAGWRFR